MATKRKTGVYKGDTLAKKLARLETWQTARDLLGEKRFQRGPHLFLVGPTGADASVAVGLGASLGELVAVDHDANIVESAHWRWPGLDIRHEDAINTVSDRVLNKLGFNFVFLDFCAQMLDDNIDAVGLALVEGLNEYGVVAAAFQASREMPKDGEYHGEILKARDVITKQLEQMPREERDNWEPLLPALSRFPVFRRALIERTSCHGMVPVPVSVIFYKSKTEGDHHGMGMCCFIVQGVPCTPRDENDPHLIEAWTRRPRFHFIDPTPSDFGLRVDALARHGQDPAMLFDLTKGTVAAYKANATRGTYQDGRAYAREFRASAFSGYWPGTYEARESEKEESPAGPKPMPVSVAVPTAMPVAISDSDYLTTDDVPCSKPFPGYDLAGTTVHDTVIVRVIANRHGFGRKWLCLCLSCGRNFARYTGQIQARKHAESFSCTTCSEELQSGQRGNRHESLKEFFRSYWETFGTLYPPSWEERATNDIRQEVFSTEPDPDSDDRVSLPIEVMPAEQFSGTGARSRRRRILLFRFGLRYGKHGAFFEKFYRPTEADHDRYPKSNKHRDLLKLKESIYHRHDRDFTLQEVGAEFGHGGERSRQVECKALRQLRHPSRTRFLKEFLDDFDPSARTVAFDRAVEAAHRALETEAKAAEAAKIKAQMDADFAKAQIKAAQQAGRDDVAAYVARLRGVELARDLELERRKAEQQIEKLQQQFPIGAVVDVTIHDGRVFRSVVRKIDLWPTLGLRVVIDGLGNPYPPEQVCLVDPSELSSYDGTLQLIRSRQSESA